MNYSREAMQAMKAILHPQSGNEALLPLHDAQYNLNTNQPQLENEELARTIANIMLNAEYLNLPLEDFGHARLVLDTANRPSQLTLVLKDVFGSEQLYEEVYDFAEKRTQARWKDRDTTE